MLLNEVLRLLLRYWPAVCLATAVVYLVRNKFNRGLNKYPGHWLASYTDLWRYFDVRGGSAERTHIELHKKHGDIVRLGPNVLSFADPKAIKVIYGLNKGVTKSDFYPVQQAVSKGRRLPSLFSTVDEDFHAKYRRCVNSAFAMSSLVSYEPLVDSTTDVFLEQTQKLYAETGKTCNFNQWLQFFAFDVIGDLTWSRRLGFVEKDEDVDGIVAFLAKFLRYAGPVGQLPILDLLFEKNPIKLLLQRLNLHKGVFPVTAFALRLAAERAPEMEKIKAHGIPASQTSNSNSNNTQGGIQAIDLLSKFTQAQHDHPAFMTDARVLTAAISMVFAGSETTAISLSAIFYFLVQHPAAYATLMAELDGAVRDGLIEDRANGSVSWAESQNLPYLDAVVQESFRLHPAAGLILERVVPAQGMTICGERIPGGTIVGCNAWVLHRRVEVFGADADAFRPERWLEASPGQLKEMKAAMFQFGAGARTCIGKNISLLEVYKLVPSFLRRFDVELEEEGREWRTHNAWFVRQLDFNTKFRPRGLRTDV